MLFAACCLYYYISISPKSLTVSLCFPLHRPWHVFVDTSPDTDADFEVAATFDEEPTQNDVNFAIVECLEGSEREDEIVAQQMQQALEAGQLDRVTDMQGIPPNDKKSRSVPEDEEDDDNFYNDFDTFEEDSC